MEDRFIDNQDIDRENLNEMVSFMGKANKRFNNLLQGIQTNHAQIEALSASWSGTLKVKLHEMITVFNTMLMELSLSQKLTFQAKDLYSGVQDLVRNKLSPHLIPPNVLSKTLRYIDTELKSQQYSVVTHDPLFYYDTATVAYQRYHSAMYIIINVPITTQQHIFHIFSISSFPVHLYEQSNHVTQFFPAKPYLGIDNEQNKYIELTEREYEQCHGQYVKFCTYKLPVRQFNSPTCTMAIFLDQTQDIMQVCDFRLIPNVFESFVMEVATDRYLISNISDITKDCVNTPSVSIQGCSLCIMTDIPCGCILYADTFPITARLTSCTNSTSNITITYPINLALLGHFFPNNVFKTIAGNTAFSSPADPQIPNFKIYEHNFSHIIADDKETQLNLRVVAQQAKTQQQVYKTLGHKILADLPIIEQSEFSNWTSIVAFASLGLNVCLFVFVVLLAYKIRKIAIITTVLLSKPNTVQTLTPPSLNWFAYSTQTPPMVSDTPCFEKPTLLLLVLCFCLMIIITLIYWLVRNCCKSKEDKFCLQLRNTSGTMLIPVLTLPPSMSPWILQGISNVTAVTLKQNLCKFQLSLQWRDLKLSSETISTTVTLPTTLKLSIYQYIKLRSILSQSYQVYFFIQVDNFLHVLVPTAPHRSSLYPTLPHE